MSHATNRARVQQEREAEERRMRAFGTAPSRYHKKAASDLMTLRFSDEPTEAERHQRAKAHTEIASAMDAGTSQEDGWRLLALADAEWFVRDRPLQVRMPNNKQWLQQITDYAVIMARQRAVAEAKRKGDPTPSPPTVEDLVRAKTIAPSFNNWYRPIEEHQTRAHRCFMNLALAGDFATIDLMRHVFQRGDEVNSALAKRLYGAGAPLAWCPTYSLSTTGERWARLLREPGNWIFRDVTEWWGKFAGAVARFYPKEPTLPIESRSMNPFLDDDEQADLF